MESSQRNVTYIFSPIYSNRLTFNLASGHFHLVLSGYANQSHNFTNLVSVTSSLLFSIVLGRVVRS